MPEFREDLLVSTISKKRVIGVIIVGIILISVFAFSSFLFGLIWGSQRPNPSDRLSEAEEETVILDLPPFPYNLSDFQTQFPNLTLDQLQDFFDMFDGDIDDLNLTSFSQSILALLGSEIEVFRIYDYYDFNDLSDNLWRYECFDEFVGDSWQSTAVTQDYDFYPYSDYFTYYWWLQKVRIQMPLTPSIGLNSMVVPTLFPIPFIMEGSVNANNLDYNSIKLYKDSYNCTTLNLNFTSSEEVNMSYELFGLDLPSDQEINNSALDESFTPDPIKNKYLQFPSSKQIYLNSHPFFQNHYNILNTIINQGDNAFEVANKIKDYLLANFTIAIDALQNDPPADGEDVVEWFCEHREGLWSEFASAFAIFCRAFNVSSRFVDGFNSRGIIEENDPYGNFVAIKYKNIYNWAEVFIPTDVSGQGIWVQMDITPILDFNLDVISEYLFYNRPSTVNLIATLTSSSSSVENRRITFNDETTQTFLGESLTDINGIASILVDLNNSHVVGPHFISASYLTIFDYTYYTILGNVQINLTDVSPAIVNISDSQPDTTRIQGYLYDPLNNKRIQNAEVNYLLFQKGTENQISNAFSPFSSYANGNGVFDTLLDLDPSVPRGNYEIRVDFNGTWDLYGFPYIFSNINGSSNRMNFNVTQEFTHLLSFFINGKPTDYPFAPNPSDLLYSKRGQQLNLSVTLLNELDMTPASGETIYFYDYTNGNINIGSDVTDSNGNASIQYDILINYKSGPTLLYANFENKYNYSYYVLNESIVFNLISGPSPPEINRTGIFGTTFNIVCQLSDTFNNPIYYSEIALRMSRLGTDYSQYLNPQYPYFQDMIGSNLFDFNLGVQPDTPDTNYTLELLFEGYFNFYNDPNNPYQSSFFINDLQTLYNIPTQLRVIDPENLTLYLTVEGIPTKVFYDDFNLPASYNRGEIAHFQVQVVHSLPLNGKILRIYNVYTNTLLDSYTFSAFDSGFVQFNISTDILTNNFHAGLNRIRVEYDIYSTINTTYIIINEIVNINMNSVINSIKRNDGGFTVSGYVEKDGVNMRGMELELKLLDKDYNDVSGYLNMPGGPFITIQYDGTGSYLFQVNSINLNCPRGKYYLRVDFNGTIDAPGIFLSDYLIHTNSSIVPLNITAGVIIIEGGFYTVPHDISEGLWYVDDVLYLNGMLTWDNGTLLTNMILRVEVQLLNGSLIAVNNSATTDSFGIFNATLIIDGTWPDYVSESKIIVYFEPSDNNLEYVEKAELEFT